VIGGLTGIMLAVVPFTHQLSDSYFVVGHFHYVLFGGTVFAIFAAIFYWYPKVTGRMMNERMGVWAFWILLLGFNLVFLPMHFSGMLGMPRRIYTYQPGRGFELWNLISTIGVPVQIVGVALVVWNMIRSYTKGAIAGNDPWDAWTLEWSTTSPPPEHNFDRIPTCTSARPLWDVKNPNDPDCNYE
jgi:cytochrome c oxidase subunit 1